MRHDLHIEIDAPDSLGVRDQWTAIAEGITAANVATIQARPALLSHMARVRYENPRRAGRADQAVASLPVVIERGRATCIEVCAIDAAARRVQGDTRARVALIDVFSERYQTTRAYTYHAIVVCGDGTIADPTRALLGAQDLPFHAAAGHCCSDCALEKPGHKTTCAPCKGAA
ncbi:MAG: hypothetical protein KAT00_12395 [Planctomycetes bacterium]|nr:hypothetical protein [Planctomycetota bacterium]